MDSERDASRRRMLLPCAVAFTSSLLLALGSPANDDGRLADGAPSLVWLGFVPLAWVARAVADQSPRRRFFVGWIGGLCVGLVGFPWIAETLVRFADAPLPLAGLGLFAFSAWTAVPFGIWVALMGPSPRHGWRAWVWPPVAWVGLVACWPAFFPYTVVIGLAQEPAWMQAAELGGVALCEAQVVLVGVLLARALQERTRIARLRLGLLGLALPVASFGLGSWRMAVIDDEARDAPRVAIGLVQPNVPLLANEPYDKMGRLWTMSRDAEGAGAQVIVWPEAGAFPYRAVKPLLHDFPDPRRRVMRLHRAPTIFGAASIDPDGQYEYNTVYALASDGRITGEFDKVVLVPFGEYVPLVDPEWAIEQIPAMSHNLAGTAPARLEVEPMARPDRPAPATIHFGPLVCYEDIFIEFARQVAVQPGGIDVFVNVTIDTWFGATAEPWEHLALAQFRSVEHRIPMVRSVSAGPSTVVDTAGRIAAALPVRDPVIGKSIDPEMLVSDVALPRNTATAPTPFARAGWFLRWIAAFAVALALLRALLRWRAQAGGRA
ncbi:MAG TPA: apolipoprotein N-acyltransferase [Nannocystaceae bacterium]|nr:apolipoprotein N-acyltransferase [Nannocystaceae bacterium]